MVEWVDIIVWFFGMAFGAVWMAWNYQRKQERKPIGTIKAVVDTEDHRVYMFLEMDISPEELIKLNGQEVPVRIAQKTQ